MILASAGSHLLCFALGVAVTLVGAVFAYLHKAAIAKAAQDELAAVKAKP